MQASNKVVDWGIKGIGMVTRIKGMVGMAYLIFVTSTTSGAGVKFFSLVSKIQDLTHFSCKNLDLACFWCTKKLDMAPLLVSSFEQLVSKNDKYVV